MSIQLIKDTQTAIHLFSDRNGYRFEHSGQHHVLPSMDKVHEFFQKQHLDTVKLCHDGKKSYVHFSLDDVEAFDSKKALRKTLSQESGGAWIEEKEGKKRYFVDDSGWFQTSFKQVSKEEFFERVDSPSTLQKVLGIGLGILALLPGALEIKERLPFGAKEAGMGLLAIQQKSPLLGALGYSLLPNSVEAQALGTEFQVNNYTTNHQWVPAIAPLNDGGFVVAWQSLNQDGDGYGIFAQRYDATGAIVGSEFQVNNYITNDQQNPTIASLNNGGFVVVWSSQGQDGSGGGIFAQRYDAASALVGSEFRVNSYTTNSQDYSSAAPLNNGGFVVAWDSNGQDGDLSGIFAQRYDANGALFGSEFQVNNHTTSNQYSPAIAHLNNGGFVVVWESLGQDGDAEGIFAQKYDANGAPFGSEFQVNNYTTSHQRFPATAPLNDGGFVVVWSSNDQDGDLIGIFAQRYDTSGAIVGSELQVNNFTTNNQQYSAITPLNDGGFIVAWMSYGQDGNSFGIFAQRYDTSGATIGSEFQVNNYTTNNQWYPSVASLNDGGFVVVWSSSGQDGDAEGIFGQRYDQDGNPVPLDYVPSMSSASAPGTTNLPSSQLSSTSSSTTVNSVLSSSSVSSTPSSSRNAPQTTELVTAPSNQVSNTSLFLSSTSREQSTTQPDNSSPSGFGIPVLIEVVYGDSYSVTQNGQTIGTFTISGGTGTYSSSSPNTLNIEIDPNFLLQDGDTVILFSIPEGEEPEFESISVTTSDDCFNAEGELVQNEENNGLDYQIIFNLVDGSCSTYQGASKFGAIPVLASGGVI